MTKEIKAELLKILGRGSFGGNIDHLGYSGPRVKLGTRGLDSLIEGIQPPKPQVKEEIYRLGKKLADLDADMAYEFFLFMPEPFKYFNLEQLEKWVEKGIAVFEEQGKMPGRNFFTGLSWDTIEEIRSEGLRFEKISRVLEIYVDALSGGALSIKSGGIIYTDTRTIFLPSIVNEFPTSEENFMVYKVIAAHKYGQLRYRSFNIRLDRIPEVEGLKSNYGLGINPEASDFECFFTLFPDRRLALDIYNVIENARVERNLKQEFKGLAKDLAILAGHELEKRPSLAKLTQKEAVIEALLQRTMGRNKVEVPKELEGIVNKSYRLIKDMLESPRPRPEDSAGITAKIYTLLEDLDSPYSGMQTVYFRGEVKPEEVTIASKKTLEELSQNVKEFIEEFGFKPERVEERSEEIEEDWPSPPWDDYEIQRMLGIKIPKEVLDKIIEELEKKLGELGELDPNMFVKVLESARKKIRAEIDSPPTDLQVELTEEDKQGAFLYDEWDYLAGNYRADWCALKEREVPKVSRQFIEETLEKYSHLISSVRRQFELFRPEYRKLKRQRDGEEIDIDAFIEALADIKAGVVPREDLYIRADKRERDLATAFLIDMSASTTGWVIQTEKEALILLCEALERLGDKYAIYGFSGSTRKQCDFYVIKGFEEEYGEEVEGRIAGMEALDYTRMGPPIRHLTKILKDVEAKIKLMIVLSDGRPEDFDEYKGDHGIEDTRKALIEAKQKHIRPFCITVDKEAKDYIEHMYGEVNYIIIDDIQKLPRRLPEIYRRLTT
jgi:nitric oxide reductase NorD protein